MNEELAAFAEEVRRATIGIVGAAGDKQRVQQLALALSDRAAVVKHGEIMGAEVADEDRFDLAGLKVDLRQHAPEHGDD